MQEFLKQNIKRRRNSYSDHPFAGKIICGDCGSLYGHDVWRVRSTGEHYDVWYCNHKYDGEVCKTRRLKEGEIKAAFERMLEKCGESNPSYSANCWRALVQSLTVYPDGSLQFRLSDGDEIKLAP